MVTRRGIARRRDEDQGTIFFYTIFSPNDNIDDEDDVDYDENNIIGQLRHNKGGSMFAEEVEDAAYHERQQAINDELDTRTGRLWTESWTRQVEEWMADETCGMIMRNGKQRWPHVKV